jgi:hypothetical protein
MVLGQKQATECLAFFSCSRRRTEWQPWLNIEGTSGPLLAVHQEGHGVMFSTELTLLQLLPTVLVAR